MAVASLLWLATEQRCEARRPEHSVLGISGAGCKDVGSWGVHAIVSCLELPTQGLQMAKSFHKAQVLGEGELRPWMKEGRKEETEGRKENTK